MSRIPGAIQSVGSYKTFRKKALFPFHTVPSKFFARTYSGQCDAFPLAYIDDLNVTLGIQSASGTCGLART